MGEALAMGILGGTGLYEMPGMEVLEEKKLDTPFGEPSDNYIIGHLEGRRVIFLSRHGRGHRRAAFKINYRANIYGLKALGADAILSVSAVGSLREEIEPLDILVPDQFINLTRNRQDTFYDEGLAVHISFADPVCPHLSEMLFQAGEESGVRMHKGGTYVCIEGPAFSTRAESELYRNWRGVDVIGMTNVTEAKLAREAEICYASLSLITDYDVWKEQAEDVTVGVIIDNMRKNTAAAQRIIQAAVPLVETDRECSCRKALTGAIVTDTTLLSEETRARYRLLLKKHLDGPG